MKLEMRCLKFQKLLTAVLCLMLLTIFSPAYAAEVSASVLPVSMISAGDGTITITLKNTNEPAEDGSGTAITDISITPSIPDVYFDTAGASIAPGESKSFSAACYFSEEMLNTSLSFTVSYTEGTRARSKDVSVKVLAAKPSSALVPLLGTTHMGEFEDEGECDRMVEVPASVADAHPGGFCVRADGECMNNRYPSDSVLFVDPNMQPFDGCAVLAETQDFQSIVRKYSRGASSLMLSPDSHDYEFEDIIVRADDAPIMLKGVVVWYQAEKDVR